MRKTFAFIIFSGVLVSCTQKAVTKDISELKAEVFKAEDDFKNLAQTKGIAEAFYVFADSNAVIKLENDSLLKGKENIRNHFSQPRFGKATVTWKPDFIEVSNDGTLAYTYGQYVWTTKDSLGNKKDFKGIFHTVWKKQKDNSWKYVWD
ncbi:YybH family protein [Flavobacterium sp.]|uniref:YybH family protein n=1 Tax=Flavobacterium sp. TaxID=239 RepID=UPI003D6ABADE